MTSTTVFKKGFTFLFFPNIYISFIIVNCDVSTMRERQDRRSNEWFRIYKERCDITANLTTYDIYFLKGVPQIHRRHHHHHQVFHHNHNHDFLLFIILIIVFIATINQCNVFPTFFCFFVVKEVVFKQT